MAENWIGILSELSSSEVRFVVENLERRELYQDQSGKLQIIPESQHTAWER